MAFFAAIACFAPGRETVNGSTAQSRRLCDSAAFPGFKYSIQFGCVTSERRCMGIWPVMQGHVLLTPTGSVRAIFFVTCRLLPRRGKLQGSGFERLTRVVQARREKYHFLLTAWVFLPDHGHAIIFPRFPVTISRVMESIKVGSTPRINAGRGESGLPWQPRFFDRAVRTVEEYYEGNITRGWNRFIGTRCGRGLWKGLRTGRGRACATTRGT